MPHALTLPQRAACYVADALAFMVSTVRPLATWTEEDDEGEEVSGRCVFIEPRPNVSPWRLRVWLDKDTDPEGCVHAIVLGCRIEVYYLRRMPAAAAVTR